MGILEAMLISGMIVHGELNGTGGQADNPRNKTAREETPSLVKLAPPLAKGEDGRAKYFTCGTSESGCRAHCVRER